MKGLWTEETKKLAMDVAKGNPGALRVIDELLWYSDWFKMMQWCKENNMVGADLWMKYKDEFGQDVYKLGDWIKKQIYFSIPKEKRSPINLDISY